MYCTYVIILKYTWYTLNDIRGDEEYYGEYEEYYENYIRDDEEGNLVAKIFANTPSTRYRNIYRDGLKARHICVLLSPNAIMVCKRRSNQNWLRFVLCSFLHLFINVDLKRHVWTVMVTLSCLLILKVTTNLVIILPRLSNHLLIILILSMVILIPSCQIIYYATHVSLFQNWLGNFLNVAKNVFCLKHHECRTNKFCL